MAMEGMIMRLVVRDLRNWGKAISSELLICM